MTGNKLELKPILITGAHRSGTTWVGKMIANSPHIEYIHEPFNIDYNSYKGKPDYWFHYVTRENEGLLYEHIKHLVTPKLQSPPLKNKNIKRLFKFFNSRPQTQRVLVKDPIAVFSVQWLAARFNMDVVMMIRHPAAFVHSLRQQGWTHDFNHFLAQPLLMKDHLQSFREEIRDFSRREHGIIDQAVLLWKLIYYMVGKYREKYHNFLFIRHEDLAADPLNGFKDIFKYLKIDSTNEIKKFIREHSSVSNPINGDVHSIKRDSKALVKKWKDTFTDEEIKKIRDGVEPVSSEFYPDHDW